MEEDGQGGDNGGERRWMDRGEMAGRGWELLHESRKGGRGVW
jgi:hypothetical protein